MPSHKNLLLALSRLPRGVRFIPLGRINRPMSDLQVDLRNVRCSLLEVHCTDGSVRGFSPHDLASLRDASQNISQPGFLIAFTADQHAALAKLDSRPNLYAALEADEALGASPDHQLRFPSPSALREHLHSCGAGSLHPDDYAHRLAELDAAGASAPDAATAGRIKRFRTTAAKYLAAASDDVPEGKFYTTDRSFLAENATRMPCEVVSCPVIEEPKVTAQPRSAALPPDENAPLPRRLPEPKSSASETVPTKPVQNGQFSLAL